MMTLVAANSAQNTNNDTSNNINNNNASAAPPPDTSGARFAHILSIFTNFAGGLLTLIGACLQQRRYKVFGTNYYDFYFYTFKTSTLSENYESGSA